MMHVCVVTVELSESRSKTDGKLFANNTYVHFHVLFLLIKGMCPQTT